MSSTVTALARAGLAATILSTGTLAQAGPYMTVRHPSPEPQGAWALCQHYAWACETSGAKRPFSDAQMAIVRRVNDRVNRTTRQISDLAQYARADVWALPTRRGGDCEDFALLKKKELIRAGIAPDRLLIATVLDLHMRGHAVLVVRTNRGDMVLDNLVDRVLPWQETGYIFMSMQSPDKPGAWDAIIAGGPLLDQKRG